MFLITSRLVKRRAVAKELCEAGRALINGHEGKPARKVKPGDLVTLRFSARTIDLEIAAVPAKAGARPKPEELYRIIKETRAARDEVL